MPNGISCAYFAVRNHKAAKEDKNVFREGIAGIQAVRTIDAAAKTLGALPAAPIFALGGKNVKTIPPSGATLGSTLPAGFHKAGNVISGMARVGRKLVYPLIGLSGVLNTIRSEDKVKTGLSQATGIGLMYTAETIAEKILIPLTKKIDTIAVNKPVLKGAWSVARGALYVAASLGGYELGNRITSSFVDKFRNNKHIKTKQKIDVINKNPIIFEKLNVFSSMKLN